MSGHVSSHNSLLTTRNSVIVLTGPTGAGKSALALDLAKKFDGEIISADSRQIYIGMDIGTDKPGSRQGTPASRQEPIFVEGIAHYLIDIFPPTQQYSAAEFREDALQVIERIHERRKLPIIVGGTGFYVRVLAGHRSLPSVPPDPAFRAWAEQQPLTELVRELETKAPDLFAGVDSVKNKRRVIRALEIARGRPQKPGNMEPLSAPFDVLKLALLPPAEILEQRLARRVEEYFRRGFVKEVESLGTAYGKHAPGLQSVGYREILSHLHGESTLEGAKEAVLRSHRQYVRRQLVWLKKEPELIRVNSATEALRRVSEFLGKPLPTS